MQKFYFSLKKYLLLCIFLNVVNIVANTIILLNTTDIDVSYKMQLFFALVFTVILLQTLAWHKGLKRSYAGVNNIGIEIKTIVFGKTYQYFIPWSRVVKVRYINLLFSKELYVHGDRDLRYIYFSIRLSLINTDKFKAAVIAHSHPDNLLHKAVIKYL